MSLQNLNELIRSIKESCATIRIANEYRLNEEFKHAYSESIAKEKPDGYCRVAWNARGDADIETTQKKHLFVAAESFFVAEKLVPLYQEICKYRKQIVDATIKHFGDTEKLKNIKEETIDSIINSLEDTDVDDASFMRTFLSSKEWWGGGKTLDRPDYYVSPLMQAADLQAQTQSHIASIAKHFAEHPELIESIHATGATAQSAGERQIIETTKGNPLMERLLAALMAKPFAILAGHSGTGKSRLVRKLAFMTCNDAGLMAEASNGSAPGNFCMVQVKPNWHDSSDLLGYYSEYGKRYHATPFVEFVCKAAAYPDTPFFVCLDEMNLAPVEQYFAEYLSAIESAKLVGGNAYVTDAMVKLGEHAKAEDLLGDNKLEESLAWLNARGGLAIPKNLFVVGTVNMDETTCQFSRKVLDRAMTLVVDEVDFSAMGKEQSPPGPGDLLEAADIAKLLERKVACGKLSDNRIELLNKLGTVLKNTPFAVAYRFANEYALYADALAKIRGKDPDVQLDQEALDHCILMKVLPRIHGERSVVSKMFKGDTKASTSGGLRGIFANSPSNSGDGGNVQERASLTNAKIDEILSRDETYLSFWP